MGKVEYPANFEWLVQRLIARYGLSRWLAVSYATFIVSPAKEAR